MKSHSIRKLSTIVFISVSIIVFLAGTAFTAMHRWNVESSIASKENILAIAAGCFLTVAELAFFFIHSLLESRDLWRKAIAFIMSIALISTITYAACTEAEAFMNEGNLASKAKVISDFSKEQQSAAATKREKALAIRGNQETLKETMKEFTSPSFTPFAVNFFMGLLAIIIGTTILPYDFRKRKTGNIMNPEIKAQAEKQLGFELPSGATAYDDGKGSSVTVRNGRQYLTTVSKKKIGF